MAQPDTSNSIAPAIYAAIAHMRLEALKHMHDTVAEALGAQTETAVAEMGRQALNIIRGWFQKKADEEAIDALAIVERYPDKPAYQQQLIAETQRIADQEPAFAHELKALSQQATANNIGQISQTINNQSSNTGIQGIFLGPASNNSQS